MIKCEQCAKEFKTQQGLVGHLRFVHGIKTSKQASLFPSKRLATEQLLYTTLAELISTHQSLLSAIAYLIPDEKARQSFDGYIMDLGEKASQYERLASGR